MNNYLLLWDGDNLDLNPEGLKKTLKIELRVFNRWSKMADPEYSGQYNCSNDIYYADYDLDSTSPCGQYSTSPEDP